MALTKQQKEWIALLGLLAVAAVVWYGYSHQSAAAGTGVPRNADFKQINAQDFGKFIVDLEKTQGTEYKSAGRNIFVMGPAPVQTASNGQVQQKKLFRIFNLPQPPPPPPPPVLPWVFFGYGSVPTGGPRQAFLKEKDNDDVHIVNEGDLLLNHLRILRIGNDRIDFEDINTGLRGSNNLEAPPSS